MRLSMAIIGWENGMANITPCIAAGRDSQLTNIRTNIGTSARALMGRVMVCAIL